MILKGASRKDGGQLANYLLSSKNEQVLVLDIRGTVVASLDGPGLKSALRDMDEYGKMTRAQKPIFHLAMNPANDDRLSGKDWLQAVDRTEQALGLSGHARAIVAHTYRGKEHYHVVWSRVDVETRKCAHLSYTNLKLCNLARELELDLGLQQVPGRARGEHQLRRELKPRERQIENFQQERAGDVRDQLKTDVSTAWHQSKDGAEFQRRLQASGYRLVQGDRCPLVLDRNGEAHSPARLVAGVNVREVKAKCAGITGELLPLDQVREPRKPVMAPRRARNMVRHQLEQLVANDRQPERGRKLAPEP